MIPMPPSHCVNWRHMSSDWSSGGDVREHGRPGRREARHRLEVGVDGPVELRARPRAGRGGPRASQRASHVSGDDEEPLAEADRTRPSSEPLECEADERRDRAGGEERPEGLAVPDRERSREQHGDATGTS